MPTCSPVRSFRGVRVLPGTYTQNLTITAPVTVVAQARGTVEIAPRRGTALTLKTDAVMLTDLVLRGRDEELPVVDAPRGQVADGQLRDHRRLLGRAARPQQRLTGPAGLPGDQRRGRRRGRHLAGGELRGVEARGSVEDCDISSTDQPAVALEGSSTTTVLRTLVHDTSAGLHVTSESRTLFEDVRVTHTSGAGIVAGKGSDPLLRRCRVTRTEDHAILVADRSRGTFEDCWAERARHRRCG